MQEKRGNASPSGRDDPPSLDSATREQMKTDSPDGALIDENTPKEAAQAGTQEAVGGTGEGIPAQAEAKAGEVLGQARDAAGTIARGRNSAAEALESAAGRLEEGTASSEGIPAQVADRTAQGMHTAAEYLKEHDTSELLNGVERYVKTHPLQSVLVAAAAGLVLGRALASATHKRLPRQPAD